MKPYVLLVLMAALATILSACTLYESPSGGSYSLVPGYDYSLESERGDPVVAPNGLLRPF